MSNDFEGHTFGVDVSEEGHSNGHNNSLLLKLLDEEFC